MIKPLLASFVLLQAGAALAASVSLSGPDGTGFLSMSGVKAWGTEPNPVTQSPFPWYVDPADDRYINVVALPLSATFTYAEEASFTVSNKINTQADFATFSAGDIQYDASGLAGGGSETIGTSALTFAFANGGFSPKPSPYNVGSGGGNFGWRYNISASNVQGSGLTFMNGVLSAIDLSADIGVTVYFGDNNAGIARFRSGSGTNDPSLVYQGKLAIQGNQYAFAMDTTASPYTFLGQLQDTRMVFNRSGSIAGVTPIPEPSTYALWLAGLAGMGLVARSRRKALKP